MGERISSLLKGTQFFNIGTVKFASNHPDHVYLLEVEGEDNQIFTVLYDKRHDYLNISKHRDGFNKNNNEEEPNIHELNMELSEEQKVEIKHYLEQNGNNVAEENEN